MTLFAAEIAKDVNCDYNLARQLLERNLAARVTSTTQTAEVLDDLGMVLEKQGDLVGALSKYEESLAMRLLTLTLLLLPTSRFLVTVRRTWQAKLDGTRWLHGTRWHLSRSCV